MSKTRRRPKVFYGATGGVLIIGLAGLFWYLKIKVLYGYLAGVSIVTFLFYGFDKHRAKIDKGRIPEMVLHGLTLIGGTVGALIGQVAFRHKTKKWRFQVVFVGIVILQIAALWYGWKFIKDILL
ncbi:MAG: DUF1294 domain-containing protein [Planctomycetes bacterium]|nr:DUF1294 domain-containing protein [Planctomycetota bacterium]